MNYLCTLVALCVLHPTALRCDEEPEYLDNEPALNQKRYAAEVKAGSLADMLENKHDFHSHQFKHLNRRFVPAYAYQERGVVQDSKLVPVRAPPELVLAIAKKSAELEASKPKDPVDEDLERHILRSGDYWNGVWKEEVDMSTHLRTNDVVKPPRSIRAKVMPGSQLYQLVSVLKRMSPKLLYVINKDE